MRDWKEDKRWTDAYLDEVKGIVGRHIIAAAPPEEDAQRNTDLIVLTMAAVRVGVRLRTVGYASKYPDEFTVRSGRPSGAKTELAKIIEGWGDYFFYGFADDGALNGWMLGDLNVFRLWLMRCLQRDKRVPGYEKHNHDGSSSFRVFSIADLPKEFVVAREVYVKPQPDGMRKEAWEKEAV